MGRRRIHWPHGNPTSDAWQLEAEAGQLVARRNHIFVNRQRGGCQGWDVWLDGTFLGVIGTRSLSELAELPRETILQAARRACCALYQDFSQASRLRAPWGGARPGAGRKPIGAAKRVSLTAMVAPTTLERIDRLRGETSRGQFLDHVLERYQPS